MRFKNADIALCLCNKQEGKELLIVAIYVHNLNLFRTNKIMIETITMLKSVFEMRDLGRTSFCIGLQFEHLPIGILLHQNIYTRRLLQQFCMHTKITS
jgi:hypothetical protein